MKKAFTLAELLVSITILGIVFGAILFFLSASVESITQSQKGVNTAQTVFSLKRDLDTDFHRGLTEFQIIPGGEGGYNAVVFFDPKQTEGMLFGVVDNNTKQLKAQKTYGKNFLGIRSLSEGEVSEVLTTPAAAYAKEFLPGTIYNLSIIKDFDIEVYTGDRVTNPILDITFSILTYENAQDDGKSFTDLQLSKDVLFFYNFVF